MRTYHLTPPGGFFRRRNDSTFHSLNHQSPRAFLLVAAVVRFLERARIKNSPVFGEKLRNTNGKRTDEKNMIWVVTPPRMPVVTNEGLGWDSLLEILHQSWYPGQGGLKNQAIPNKL